jgi:hypothetical protein
MRGGSKMASLNLSVVPKDDVPKSLIIKLINMDERLEREVQSDELV